MQALAGWGVRGVLWDFCENFNVLQRTLTDIRDGEKYRVRKLADGNVWMTENLRLVGPFKPDKSDSDVTWNRTDADAFQLTASNSSAWCTASDAECINQSMVLYSGNTDYGMYYNWYAATAGTGIFETVAGNTDSSICPNGWRLPASGSSGNFKVLYDQYPSSAAMKNFPANFIMSGYKNGSGILGQDVNGLYWSSTATNSNVSYYLLVNDSTVNPAGGSRKYSGLTLRCLAR